MGRRAPIGDGGFGAVFEAEGTDGEKAAVKLAPEDPGTEREMLFTDLDGVRNVVPVIDSGEHQDQWVPVMPRVEKTVLARLDGATYPAAFARAGAAFAAVLGLAAAIIGVLAQILT